MARWRDIKQNKKSSSPQKKTQLKEEGVICAPPLSRMKAYIVDSFMVTMPVMYIVIYLIIGDLVTFSEQKLYGWSIILGFHSAIIIWFWIAKKESPGMRAYELKLIHNNPEKHINLMQLIARYIITIISSVTFFSLLPFFRKDKKAFQDLLTNTSIISVETPS
ncbi:MAG: RDD family protein [Campylobacterota bacterium]|nr:RDD family protein [Campylobacterota bacterium]